MRFGRGVVHELGMDLKEMGARRVALVTDARLAQTPAFERAVGALESQGIPHAIFAHARCEPTDESMRAAGQWAREADCDAFVAVGGGSAIDTAKGASGRALPSHQQEGFSLKAGTGWYPGRGV